MRRGTAGGGRAPQAEPAPATVELAQAEPQAPGPDPALERARIERARVARGHLRNAIANPHLAQFGLPWQPAVPKLGGTCSGYGLKLSADRRATHAVEASTKHAKPREPCIEWALGITR